MREVLTRLDGVATVETNLGAKEAKVVYHPAKTNPDQMAKALTDHRGEHDFTAVVKPQSG